MADTPGYPATLRLAGRRVLVVGGGTVATRRIPALLDAGAVVDVIAPDASTEIREAAGAGRLRWRQRRFQPRDVLEPEPAWLVHAATDSPAVNAVVATACDEHRVWCVRADDADASSVWTPAVAHGAVGTVAEGVTVAVTGGGDPRRAAAVRDAVLAGLDSGLLPVRRQRPPALDPTQAQVIRFALVGGGPGCRGSPPSAAVSCSPPRTISSPPTGSARARPARRVPVSRRRGRRRGGDAWAPPDPAGPINEILVEHARLGRDVVVSRGRPLCPRPGWRGGDPLCRQRDSGRGGPGRDVRRVGTGRRRHPVTHRGITASFVVASAHDGATAALDALRVRPAGDLDGLLNSGRDRAGRHCVPTCGRSPVGRRRPPSRSSSPAGPRTDGRR